MTHTLHYCPAPHPTTHFSFLLLLLLYQILWNLYYRIYSINLPERLLNFWTLKMGAYLRWALIRGCALIKFSPFSASKVCLFCNKTRFLWNTLKKTPSSGSRLLEFIHSSGWGGGERLFEFDWEEEGWALIRGWPIIRINTVYWKPCQTLFFSLWPELDSAPNKQDEPGTTASLSLAERWTITKICRRSNSVLTYSLLTDVLPL